MNMVNSIKKRCFLLCSNNDLSPTSTLPNTPVEFNVIYQITILIVCYDDINVVVNV